MSFLLVDGPALGRWSGVTDAVIERLKAAGDQVRVLVDERDDSEIVERLRRGGVYVALGDASNGDLMERAAQGCRTIVLFDPSSELAAKALEAARFARVERLIVCSKGPRRSEDFDAGEQSFVWLGGRPKGGLRAGVGWEDFAAAVDAADDLAGDVQLDLSLDRAEDWSRLGLTRPGTPRGSSRPS